MRSKAIAFDLKPKAAARTWDRLRRAQTQYGSQLRKIARHIGELIKGFDVHDPAEVDQLIGALKRYADVLTPWARTAAKRMIAEVHARSNKQWRALGNEMGGLLREEFEGPEIGVRFRMLQEEQVDLITSIPRDAAERIQNLVTQGVIQGKRYSELVPEIKRGGEVSESKANLIARTETGRVISNLTQARAESVGSVGYHWATVHDASVRPSHKAMDGQFVRWDSPPTLDGITAHAGAGINCRCFAIPSIPMPGGRYRAEAA